MHGNGEITLIIGMSIVTLSGVSGSITLDSTLQETYNGFTSLNSQMNGEYPRLLPGTNAVSWMGNVSELVIQPNWRSL